MILPFEKINFDKIDSNKFEIYKLKEEIQNDSIYSITSD
jgi:hypothetical protein